MDPDRGPVELLNKVQFDIRYYFCRRGCENIYDMTKDTFQLAFNTDTGMSYVYKAKDELQKNHKESNNPVITGFMPQLYDPSTGRPHKSCPVRSFENYIHHLNERCPQLWQTPNPAAFRRGEPIWYKNKRIGENKIASFMSELSKDAKLSKKYTNHCVRVTGTTNLTRAHFTPNQIMAVTGHKSVNSLAMYQRVKGDEKLMMGMSLAYNLMNPQEVYEKLQIPIQPKPAIAPPQPSPQLQIKVPNAQPTASNMQMVPVADGNAPANSSFDLLDFINYASDDEILLAATQMEEQYTSEKMTTTTIVKKSPKKSIPVPFFTGCKIGTINIHIHKN